MSLANAPLFNPFNLLMRYPFLHANRQRSAPVQSILGKGKSAINSRAVFSSLKQGWANGGADPQAQAGFQIDTVAAAPRQPRLSGSESSLSRDGAYQRGTRLHSQRIWRMLGGAGI